jgi:hypothetical protein
MILKKPGNSKKRIVIIFSILGVLILAGAAGSYYYYSRMKSVTNYDECVAAGNPIMDSYPEQCMTPDKKHFTNPHASRAFEGVAVCLPHKDTGGPQTLECAIGIKTEDGTYYGISGDKDNDLGTLAGSDKKVRVTGTVEPSTDTKYNIKELINVTEITTL